MTGYGLSSCQFDDYRITAELKTVNNRYLDTNVRVYKQYSFVEELVRDHGVLGEVHEDFAAREYDFAVVLIFSH